MKLIKTHIVLSLLLGAALSSPATQAAEHKFEQAPGYYHMNIGDFRITALNDGTRDMAAHRLLHWDEEKIQAALAEHYLTSPVEGSINGFLVNTGEQQILIDTGMGDGVSPNLGQLSAHLQAAGYQLTDIDAVYITHMHGDHISGLLTDGERTFPNARLYVHERDANYWLSETEMNKAPEGRKGSFKNAMRLFAPYQNANALITFSDGQQLHDGIIVNPTPGHTPGHSVYRVESDAETMVIWGDTLHVAAVQFAHPEVTIAYDSNPDEARAQRLQLLEKVAAEGHWVAGAHISFPGIGRVKKEADGYRWVPANYTTQID
ncbi:MBL fold metallo-hydrolase [Pseudidiomarina insulisalsae]|uniref:MBL fold metallo-hydrolase n=1 Tax=Pseudidiomarina insulisalsae TaxID=575789 RepID=A0A432YMC6_9GAMM|nr:MBL fold metallo-hydrolase [Pseudidiomarina insulisalsae]RUO62137.1 MBL fold metallo-hydrolase [Pseudidiomarina insulisalsae]